MIISIIIIILVVIFVVVVIIIIVVIIIVIVIIVVVVVVVITSFCYEGSRISIFVQCFYYAFHMTFDKSRNTYFLRKNGLIIQILPFTLVPLCRLFSSSIILSLWAKWKSCLWVPASKMWVPITPAKWV